MTPIFSEGSSFRLNFRAIDQDKEPVDLTGVTSLVARIKRPGQVGYFEVAAQVSNASAGLCFCVLLGSQTVGVGDWAGWVSGLDSAGQPVRSLAGAFKIASEGTVVSQ